MPQFDMPLAELERYAPDIVRPDDFDEFWRVTLEESRAAAAASGAPNLPVLEPAEARLKAVRTHDLTFAGFGGEPVKAWVIAPAEVAHPVPAVVEFIGYGGGRGLVHERLAWAAAGYVHVVMDTRGQGSPYASGSVTPDPHGTGPTVAGWMTRGIDSPETYYYRRVFTDAVRLVETVAGLPQVDASRIAVAGISQGGGIALAAAGLLGSQVAAALVDVPFLCHFERAVAMTEQDPFGELSRYLARQRGRVGEVMRTLSYFDGANHAVRASAPALFSVALFDAVCPPSTVYAAHNRYGGPTSIDVYPFNGHEGGGADRWPAHATFLEATFAP